MRGGPNEIVAEPGPMHPYNQYDRPSLPAENSVNLTCDPKWSKIGQK